jgi:hypothetical protein
MLVAPEIIHINHSSKVVASQKTPPCAGFAHLLADLELLEDEVP